MARAAKASSELQALAGTGILTNDHGLIISHCASHCGQRTRQKSPRARHPSSPGPWAAHPTTLIHILQALPVSDSSANQSRATPQPRSQRLRPFRFSSLLIDYSLRGGKRRSCRPWPCDSAFLRLPLSLASLRLPQQATHAQWCIVAAQRTSCSARLSSSRARKRGSRDKARRRTAGAGQTRMCASETATLSPATG